MPSRLLILILAVPLAMLAACGGGDSENGAARPSASESAGSAADGGRVCQRDLAEEPADMTVFGAGEENFLGDRLAVATGDFNGDRITDLLLGAGRASPGASRHNAGEAYVIFGSVTLPGTVDLASGDAADIRIVGENVNDNLGFAVAAADVNGDRIDDIIVSARYASEGERRQTGKTYVIFGHRQLPGTIRVADNEHDVTITGRDSNHHSGDAIAASDVNGDGIADIVIAAPGGAGADGGRQRAGEVYVVLGARNMPRQIDLARQVPFFTVLGAREHDGLASGIALGDVTGDGRPELLLAAPFANRGDAAHDPLGEAYVVPVPADGGFLDLAAGEGFTRIAGRNPGDQLGSSIAAGDVDGDGRAEAIIGAQNGRGPGDSRPGAGAVHIVRGREKLADVLDLSRNDADITIHGRATGGKLGASIHAADIDGDGMADILIGASSAGGCADDRPQSGEVYVISGGEKLLREIDLADTAADLSVFGAKEGDLLGQSVNAADVDGDGGMDLLIGAVLAAGPEGDRPGAGELYAILQRPREE